MKKIYSLFLILVFSSIFVNAFAQLYIEDFEQCQDYYFESPEKITAMTSDNAGNIWVSNPDVGLSKFTSPFWRLFHKDNSFLPTNQINDMRIYRDKMYLATDSGVIVCNPNLIPEQSAIIERYTTKDGLSSNNVIGIESTDGIIYAVCADKKINIIENNSFEYISLPDSISLVLPNSYDYFSLKDKLLIDQHKNLWLASESVLFCLTKDSLYSYDLFGYITLANNKDGMLWIATSFGMFHTENHIISPEKLIFHSSSAKLYNDKSGQIMYSNSFTGIIINNNYVNIGYLTQDNYYSSIELIEGFTTIDSSYYYITNSGKMYCINSITSFDFLDINKLTTGISANASFIHTTLNQGNSNEKIRDRVNLSAICPLIAGYDSKNELHLASEYPFYIDYEKDYNSGPIDTALNIGVNYQRNEYSRLWKINRCEIEEFKGHFETQTLESEDYVIPEAILNWPAHGRGSFAKNLAPFVDVNGDKFYNPYDGDYPKIKGDQMIYIITNDVGTHTFSRGLPLGVEMHISIYAYSYEKPENTLLDFINYQTFVDIKMINRSNNTYYNTYTSLLGISKNISSESHFFCGNTYFGSDLYTDSYYFYEMTDSSDNHLKQVIQTVTLLKGPLAEENDGIDNDRDFQTDELEERIKYRYTTYFANPFHYGINYYCYDPVNPEDFYNYLTGIWKDDSWQCYGGIGHFLGGGDPNIPCRYSFPGESNPYGWGTDGITHAPWKQPINKPLYAIRGIGSIGPFTFEAGETIEMSFMLGRLPDSLNTKGITDEAFLDISDYYNEMDSLIYWFKNDKMPSNCPCKYTLANDEDYPKTDLLDFEIYPNPASSYIIINTEENQLIPYEIYDLKASLLLQGEIQSNSESINIENLSPGFYLIKLFSGGEMMEKKFIKQ